MRILIDKTKVMALLLCMSFTACMACSDSNDSTGTTPEPEPEPVPTDGVSYYLTTSNRAYDLTPGTLDFGEGSNMSPSTVRLDPATRYQQMDGFGAAITGSTSYNLSLMPAEARAKFLEETFSPEHYGYSYVRIAIGCSDFSIAGEYTCCDTEGIENFALTTEETDYVIPALKQILAINPDVKIIAAPWTCPRWMKVEDLQSLKPYNSWTGGQLNPKYYQDYATYFVKWLQAFKDAGVDVDAISVENEPLNRGNSASLYMGWEEQRDFVKTALGPALQQNGFGHVQIYAFDHNYNYDNIAEQQDYSLKIFQDAEAKKYFTGTAFHDYGGTRDELQDVHQKAPDMELLFTETSIGEWNNGRDLSQTLNRDMENIALGTVNNWCVGVIVWNLMLDSDQGPYGGPGACTTCYGAVDVDNTNYTNITRNSHYYIIAHLASVVKPGATRIGTSGYTDEGIVYAAFENTDGTYAFVLSNANQEAQRVTVDDGTHYFSFEVPARAVISYRWKK